MDINFTSNQNNSYKFLFNQRLEDKFARTTARLAAELDILRNRDIDLELNKLTTQETALSAQKSFISESIKDILDIRKSLGITEAAGDNKPLEELFQAYNGANFDKKL